MVGKIAVLQENNKGFEVVYGIGNNRHLDFAEIVLADTTPNATKTYIYGGHIVEEKCDGYKKVLVFNKELPKDAVEEYILLIVPYAQQLVENKSTRIAGRYYYEAIYELHEGDIIEVSRYYKEKKEKYMVVRAGNELFLIKKNR